jgi:hypothetical protein
LLYINWTNLYIYSLTCSIEVLAEQEDDEKLLLKRKLLKEKLLQQELQELPIGAPLIYYVTSYF